MWTFRNRGKTMVALGLVCLLLIAVGFGIGARIVSLRTANNGGKTKTLPTRITASQYPLFKGIYQFTSSNSSQNSASPYVAGSTMNFYWSELEPQKGKYNWSLIDQSMAPWTSHGKKVILRVSTSGYTHWKAPVSGHGTPQWVYNLGVASVTENDASVLPQYWNPIFLQNLDTFAQALAQRYDGSPNIAYIEIGLGVGGESKVDSHNSNPNMLQLWQHIGYTDPLWWGAVQNIMAAYQASFTKTPLAVMPDKVFIGNTKGYSGSLLLDYAVKHGIWLQDNGLWTGRILPSQFKAVPHPEEQSRPTSQSGDKLRGDIQKALDLGANYILIFSSDLNIAANLATLQWAASQVAHP